MSASTEARRLVTQVIAATQKIRAFEFSAGWQRERTRLVDEAVCAQAALIAYAVRNGADRDTARRHAKSLAATGGLYDTGGPIPGVLDWLANLEAKAAA